MSDEANVSEMLVHIGGDLLKSANSLQEMQARLDIVKTAWNISLNSRVDTKIELKRFMKKQRKRAPSKDALKGLELEIKRLIKQKNTLYPEISSKITNADAIETGRDTYEVMAHFEDKDGSLNL